MIATGIVLNIVESQIDNSDNVQACQFLVKKAEISLSLYIGQQRHYSTKNHKTWSGHSSEAAKTS